MFGLGFAALFWVVVLGPRTVLLPLGDASDARGGRLPGRREHDRALRRVPLRAAIHPADGGDGHLYRGAVHRRAGRVRCCLGEALTGTQILGGLLVVAAIAVVQLPERPEPELPPVAVTRVRRCTSGCTEASCRDEPSAGT